MKKVRQLHISQLMTSISSLNATLWLSYAYLIAFWGLEQSLQTGPEYPKIMHRDTQKVFQSFQIRICYQMWLYSSVKAI